MALVRGQLLLAICVIVTMTTCRAYIHSSHGCQIRQRLKAEQCLVLKTFPNGNETCANPEVPLPYSGISTTINKEEWLGVEYIDRKGLATDDKQWFVRSSDIQCDGDCCTKQRKRFFLDGLMDITCTILGCCKNSGRFETYLDVNCTCLPGYTGQLCEHKPPECLTTQHHHHKHDDCCKHEGYFINPSVNDWCECPPWHAGNRCQLDEKNLCSSRPCQNGGMCNSDHRSYHCVCQSQFYGINCQYSKVQTSTVPAPTTKQPIVTTATVSKTTMTQIITNCADNPLVSCSNSQACSSSLQSYCPLSCGLCTPPTTPPPCVDNPLVKCSDPSICSSLLKDVCPLTCGLCVPVTTAKPCLDSNLVNCSARSVCTSQFKSYCSKTCKLCGISQVLTSPSATTWIPING